MGIDNEIAKGHVKTGKNGNLTAWDLLKMSMLEGGEQFGKLFQEFAISFKVVGNWFGRVVLKRCSLLIIKQMKN